MVGDVVVVAGFGGGESSPDGKKRLYVAWLKAERGCCCGGVMGCSMMENSLGGGGRSWGRYGSTVGKGVGK